MNSQQSIIYWLYACCASVVVMVLLGGLTRLTDSGLSITAWEPLSGVLPPMNPAEWEGYFAEYKKIPEYIEINAGITLEQFKEIFWLEYIHRLFGRIAGFIFFIPFIYFLIKKQLSKKLTYRLLFIFALGAVQGAVGWYMVSSGLTERTDVSQYRLALHLITAFIIYAMLLKTLLNIKYPNPIPYKPDTQWAEILPKYSNWLTYYIFFMVFLGALVAGTDAGFIYNTFPKMGSEWVPDELYHLSPWWINHFENQSMVQFQHRLVAVLLSIDIIIFSILLIVQKPAYKKYGYIFLAALVLQVALGISTLIGFAGQEEYFAANGYKKIFQPNMIFAEAHQLGSLLLLSISIITTHKLLRKA